MSTPDYRPRLIAARERLGLSRREMAKLLLTPRATYEQWEFGKRRTPGVAVIAAEAQVPTATIASRVLPLCDGTKTMREIAVYLGLTYRQVSGIIVSARTRHRQPYPTLIAQLDDDEVEMLAEEIVVKVDNGEALNPATIAVCGYNYERARQRAARMCDERGIARLHRGGRPPKWDDSQLGTMMEGGLSAAEIAAQLSQQQDREITREAALGRLYRLRKRRA